MCIDFVVAVLNKGEIGCGGTALPKVFFSCLRQHFTNRGARLMGGINPAGTFVKPLGRCRQVGLHKSLALRK